MRNWCVYARFLVYAASRLCGVRGGGSNAILGVSYSLGWRFQKCHSTHALREAVHPSRLPAGQGCMQFSHATWCNRVLGQQRQKRGVVSFAGHTLCKPHAPGQFGCVVFIRHSKSR